MLQGTFSAPPPSFPLFSVNIFFFNSGFQLTAFWGSTFPTRPFPIHSFPFSQPKKWAPFSAVEERFFLPSFFVSQFPVELKGRFEATYLRGMFETFFLRYFDEQFLLFVFLLSIDRAELILPPFCNWSSLPPTSLSKRISPPRCASEFDKDPQTWNRKLLHSLPLIVPFFPFRPRLGPCVTLSFSLKCLGLSVSADLFAFLWPLLA